MKIINFSYTFYYVLNHSAKTNKQLYAKHNLDDSEIAFIESNVKEME